MANVVRALQTGQTPIKARVGQQNVSRVLTNATSPPAKLINLDDVDATFQSDGLILVWDLPSRQFLMTSVIDSSSTTIEGIAYFENTENSYSQTTGAVIVSGGVGISKNLNVGLGLTVIGVSVFKSNVDIDASLDVLNSLVVGGSTGLNSVTVSGPVTLGDDVVINANASVNGTIFTTDGLYYETADVNDPNGIAYFDTTGKLITAPNTDSAVSSSNYILTTDSVTTLPTWTTTIDGGEF